MGRGGVFIDESMRAFGGREQQHHQISALDTAVVLENLDLQTTHTRLQSTAVSTVTTNAILSATVALCCLLSVIKHYCCTVLV